MGDGTTSVCVLAGEFLRAAEDLIAQHIHPQLIIAGWRKARTIALAKLEEIAEDHSDDEEKFYADLINIACTTLSSKIVFSDKEHFAKLCVDAVMRLKVRAEIRLSLVLTVILSFLFLPPCRSLPPAHFPAPS